MSRRIAGWIGAIVAVVSLGCSQPRQAPTSTARVEIPSIAIFTPLDEPPSGLPVDPSVDRVGLVRLDAKLFDEFVRGKSNTLRARLQLSLQLFGNEKSSLILIVDEVRVDESGRLLVTAYEPKGPGQALITYGEHLEIIVRRPEGDLMIRQWRDDVYLATRLKQQTVHQCGTRGDEKSVKPGPDHGLEALALAAGQVRAVDVLVLYTPAVLKNWVCGPSPDKKPCDEARKRSGLEEYLRTGVDEVNMHLTCSRVPLQIVAPAIQEYEYAEKGTIGADLDALTGSGWSKLTPLRKQYKADLIVLVAWARDLHGIAKMYNQIAPNNRDALSIVDSRAARDLFSLSHEIGHNMGAGHYPGDGTGAYPYARGWYYLNGPQEPQVTILGRIVDSGAHRINRFSNPDIRYDGEVIGLDNANNAKAIKENRESVAEFMNGTRGVRPLGCPERDDS